MSMLLTRIILTTHQPARFLNGDQIVQFKT
nr:MAG TPA_asm: hypothetical protein [Caudoviricetes sp.]